MKHLFLPLALALLALVAEGTEKPDPKTKARQMLDAAAGTLSAAQPEIQVSALRMLGENYEAFNKKKALEFFSQAFSAIASLPATNKLNRLVLQRDVVTSAAGVDVAEAVRLLRQMPPGKHADDPRSTATTRVIQKLLETKQFDAAVELLDWAGADGDYPFQAASEIFQKLPEGDPRKIMVFGSASTANTLHPDRAYGALLLACRDQLPPEAVQSGMRAIVSEVLGRKTEGDWKTEAIATSKGTVAFEDSRDAELFDLMWLVRELDPKRADEILATRPALKSALDQFPRGSESMKTEGPMWTYIVQGDNRQMVQDMEARFRSQALIQTRVMAAEDALKADPSKALDMVPSIPDPARQAEVLGAIARTVSEQDPGRARQILNKCVALTKDIKDPADRAAPWDAIAGAAHQIDDDEMARDILDRALADAAELYKREANVSDENKIARERWPATQSYRRLAYRAGKMFGVDADALLVRITDQDLQLLARIEMAKALLGRDQPYGAFRPMPPALKK